MDKKRHQSLTFVNLALALASDYRTLYVIDPEDDSYVEYALQGDGQELIPVSEGENFYNDVPKNVMEQVWPEDQEFFLRAFKKDTVLKALKEQKSFSLTYRLTIEGAPRYFFLKTIRSTDRSIVIGVRDIDAQIRRELENEKASRTYAEIAESLASMYEVIYYIDINTGNFTQYSSSKSYAELGLTSKGEDFFKKAREDISFIIHPDDRDMVLKRLERDTLLSELRTESSVQITYRQVLDKRIQYVQMLAFFKNDDTERIVIGVRNIDRQKRHEQTLKQQNKNFSDMAMALALQYEVIYMVNLITNEYTEYSASDKYTRLDIGTVGKDFFEDSMKNMELEIYPEDLPMMKMALQKENLIKRLEGSGKVLLNYRLILDNRPQYVSLYAVRPSGDSDHLIIAVSNIDAAKRMELEYRSAVDLANRDALTEVKNKRAYAQAEMELDNQISAGSISEFSIVICDLNGLKTVNDTKGHKAGDDFIRSGCKFICDTFNHSPVFRIGGDEFAIIVKGRDFERRDQLMAHFSEIMQENRKKGLVTVACGISDFDPKKDMRVQDVFERADNSMYKNKKLFKNGMI